MEIEHVVFPFTIPGVSMKWADNTLRSGKTNPLRNVLSALFYTELLLPEFVLEITNFIDHFVIRASPVITQVSEQLMDIEKKYQKKQKHYILLNWWFMQLKMGFMNWSEGNSLRKTHHTCLLLVLHLVLGISENSSRICVHWISW